MYTPMSPFSAVATTTGIGGGVLGALVCRSAARRQYRAATKPRITATASHASQCHRLFLVGIALGGLLVDSTPESGSGGGEGVVSLMPQRVSQNRQGTSCKLGSDWVERVGVSSV
jgi:hypothetical protein